MPFNLSTSFQRQLLCTYADSRLEIVAWHAALVQGMGGSGEMPAGGDGATWRTPGDADVIGDDSALHDRMMFGDDTLDTSDAEAMLGHDLVYKTSPAELVHDM